MNDASRAAETMRELASELARHDDLYYNKGAPEISDAAYDALRRKLEALTAGRDPPAEARAQLEKIGAPPTEGLAPAPHDPPMLSLRNAHDEADARAFLESVRRFLGLGADAPLAVAMEPKYDGLALAARYEGGALVRLATRGDGAVGEDVSHNLAFIQGLPSRLNGDAPPRLDIYGEVYIPRAAFDAFNARRAEAGETLFANARNAAAGFVRRLPESAGAAPEMRFVAYNWTPAAALATPSYAQGLRKIADWGFEPVSRASPLDDWPALVAAYEALAEARATTDYEADGAVLKLDDLALRARLGDVGGRPRWAVAWKFAAEEARAPVRAITFNVGREGALTPVAEVEGVNLGGVVVRRASLHNLHLARELDLRVGDTALLRRAGGVIPEIIAVDFQARPAAVEAAGPLAFPETCPSCGGPLTRPKPEREERLCPNRWGCPERLRRRLAHCVSRAGLDVEGLGETIIATLFDAGLVRNLADVFTLEARARANPPDFWRYAANAPKGKAGTLKEQARKLFAAIDARRAPPLERFLYALGLSAVGQESARALARAGGTLAGVRALVDGWSAALADADGEDAALERAGALAAEHDGVGPEMVLALRDAFAEAPLRAELDALEAAGVAPQPWRAPEAAAQGALSGLTIVFSGGLEGMTRREATARARAQGAAVAATVSPRVAFVVSEQKASAKVKRAHELGVEVLDERAFRIRLGEAPS